MQAFVERAYQLALLSPTQRSSTYKLLSAKGGWRTREVSSEDVTPEGPSLARAITEDLSARGLSSDDIASTAGFSAPVRNTLSRAPIGLRVVRATGFTACQ